MERSSKKVTMANNVKVLADDSEESDHHGKFLIDYLHPLPRMFESSWTLTNYQRIATGTFSRVFLATVKETGLLVCIKKITQDKTHKARELQIMRGLHHPNIVMLIHGFFEPMKDDVTQGMDSDKEYEIYSDDSDTKKKKRKALNMNIVMEFIPGTLSRLKNHFNQVGQAVHPLLVKLYAYQLMRGLNYIHRKGIMHRDVKPENILIDPTCHVLKICDFGSSKRLDKDELNTNYITTRNYRAPELIVGKRDYDYKIDIWSAGVVIAELLYDKPFFGYPESQNSLLLEMVKKIGSPEQDLLLDWNPKFTKELPVVQPKPMKKILDSVELVAVDFVSKLLQWDPADRLGGLEALNHPYFDQLKEEGLQFPSGNCMPDIFAFTQEEFDMETDNGVKETIIPDWYKGFRPEKKVI